MWTFVFYYRTEGRCLGAKPERESSTTERTEVFCLFCVFRSWYFMHISPMFISLRLLPTIVRLSFSLPPKIARNVFCLINGDFLEVSSCSLRTISLQSYGIICNVTLVKMTLTLVNVTFLGFLRIVVVFVLNPVCLSPLTLSGGKSLVVNVLSRIHARLWLLCRLFFNNSMQKYEKKWKCAIKYSFFFFNYGKNGRNIDDDELFAALISKQPRKCLTKF